jgi:hypothetical protein
VRTHVPLPTRVQIAALIVHFSLFQNRFSVSAVDCCEPAQMAALFVQSPCFITGLLWRCGCCEFACPRYEFLRPLLQNRFTVNALIVCKYAPLLITCKLPRSLFILLFKNRFTLSSVDAVNVRMHAPLSTCAQQIAALIVHFSLFQNRFSVSAMDAVNVRTHALLPTRAQQIAALMLLLLFVLEPV